MSSHPERIAEVREWIRDADSIVALTGAGISTDSGIPDFRGPKGVWTVNPDAEKMAHLQYYMADLGTNSYTRSAYYPQIRWRPCRLREKREMR